MLTLSNIPFALKQVRKPYTITKQREKWTEEEHQKFLEALRLYGRGWRQIEGKCKLGDELIHFYAQVMV